MGRPALLLAACALAATTSLARAQIPAYYIYGNFCSSCGTPSPVNQLYDDGAHDDGAAGDEVYGAIITVDRPAGHYLWGTDMGGDILYCPCTTPSVGYANLWTSGPGDVIHIRVGGSPPGTGWQGEKVSAGSHGIPPGARLELAFPNLDDDPPGPGYAAQLVGGYWQCIVTVPTAGTSKMMFRSLDHSALYSATYNCWCACFAGQQPFVTFTTTKANSDVLFQFDPVTGRMRALELGPTPARASSWGSVRTRYR